MFEWSIVSESKSHHRWNVQCNDENIEKEKFPGPISFELQNKNYIYTVFENHRKSLI